MDIEVILVNSFTADGQGGNPAGVVFNADDLSDVQKLNIAQQVGYSETAFVANDNEVDFAVSFFTKTQQVDFCGHATLATFSAMYQKGMITSGSYLQRTKAGILPVDIASNGKVVMAQKLPQKLKQFSYLEIANIIGIDADILASSQLPIEAISTGLADVMIPVPLGYLDTIEPDDSAIAKFCKQQGVAGFHAFELCPENSRYTASCRNFAPLFDISEESATGSASGALACYLAEHLSLTNHYVFEQGRAMNCASIITASVETTGSKVVKVEVGGFANYLGVMEVSL